MLLLVPRVPVVKHHLPVALRLAVDVEVEAEAGATSARHAPLPPHLLAVAVANGKVIVKNPTMVAIAVAGAVAGRVEVAVASLAAKVALAVVVAVESGKVALVEL